jgi:hypothetical protein
MISQEELENMSNKELIKGLMRGFKPDFQQGYGPVAAVSCLDDLGRFTEDTEYAEALNFAEGFRDGMNENREIINPAGV